MSAPDYADLIERLSAAATDARAAAREAHEARKDLAREVKEARELVRDLVATEWDERVGEAVAANLTGLKERIDQVVEVKSRQIIAAFDRLTRTFTRGQVGVRAHLLGAGMGPRGEELAAGLAEVEAAAQRPLTEGD